MASLQQAIDKGMPPDQAIQYVKSMAQQGIAPLADLYSMMMQFERLKQQKVQPPPAGTIRDQLNQMEQMQAQAATQPVPQMQAPINQGLGAVNAGAMENPQFAGGGIVAFRNRGLVEDIDFTKMSDEQLAALEGSDDVKVARAALGERLRRSGYMTPGQLAGKYISAVRAGVDELSGGPLVRFDNSRKFPSYMYDEEGNVRRGEVTGGIAGTPYFSSSRGTEEAIAAAIAPTVAPTQSAVPTTASPFAAQAAPASFDQMLAGAQRGVPQDVAPAAPLAAGIDLGVANASRGRDPFANLIEQVQERKFQDLPDTFTPEERKRIEKDISKLETDKQRAANMALAQAGFGMAAAASRSGRQRTSTLGALAEGALAGMQQYNANQKELRQTERDLNREMRVLNQYADQVARGERTAKRDFEEDKQNRIADLTGKSETLRLQNAQLAQAMNIAKMQYGPEGTRASDADYKNKVLEVEILNNQIKSIDDQLKSYTLSDADKAVLRAERTRLIAQMNALRSSGGVAAISGAGTAAITSSGWND